MSDGCREGWRAGGEREAFVKLFKAGNECTEEAKEGSITSRGIAGWVGMALLRDEMGDTRLATTPAKTGCGLGWGW